MAFVLEIPLGRYKRKGRLQVKSISNCNSVQVSLAFPKQESAIEAAIQAGQQKIDVGFERGPIVVNG
jgi:hypothetical protein